MKIKEMKPGDSGKVTGYEKGERALRDRLISMGLTRGAEFTVKKMAPLGDPAEIVVRGFSLSLRKAEVDLVMVEGI